MGWYFYGTHDILILVLTEIMKSRDRTKGMDFKIFDSRGFKEQALKPASMGRKINHNNSWVLSQK